MEAKGKLKTTSQSCIFLLFFHGSTVSQVAGFACAFHSVLLFYFPPTLCECKLTLGISSSELHKNVLEQQFLHKHKYELAGEGNEAREKKTGERVAQFSFVIFYSKNKLF